MSGPPSLDDMASATRTAWLRLRHDLQAELGGDLVAIWAYGSTVAPNPPRHPADLDAHVIVRLAPDGPTAHRVQEILDTVAEQEGANLDVWVITHDAAQRSDPPPHAFLEDRRDTAWAIHRAHWLAGAYINVYGREPSRIVPPPTWDEVMVDLDRELEHIERHVAEGDTDSYEASYAVLNGSRILHTTDTLNPVISKRDAGLWALHHLPDRWHPAIHAALRAYDNLATPQDAELLAAEMAPFVAMVREALPTVDGRSPERPRWSGC